MKQFTVEEYQKNPNRKVITRDGRSVRILCTDQKGTEYSVVALCTMSNESENCYFYFPSGRMYLSADSCMDLFFAPEKRSGWINIYDRTGDAHASRCIYDTEEEALKCASVERVDTIKIEWEE